MKEDKRKGRGFRWANDEAFDRDFDMDEYDKRPVSAFLCIVQKKANFSINLFFLRKTMFPSKY